ncbi:MAG: hypothetical protein LBS63_05960 [Prevotellaceae bacterium]|nr:hypothetical protein [Prevotellaceae bacterium]
MKTRTLAVNIAVLCTAAVVAPSCGDGAGKKSRITTEQVASEMTEYPIPSAYEITNLINRAGVAYIIDLTNPVGSAQRYLTEAKKAVNVGVYGADLAYVTTYNQTQAAMDYMKVLKKLGDELQVSANVNASLVYQVEKNIDNKDSLISIISQSFRDTYAFLVNNGKDAVSLQVLVGTWVEGLYIATHATTYSAKQEDMLQVVANQKQSLETLKALIQKQADVPEVADLLTLLAPVVSEFDKVETSLSPQQLQSIGKAIEDIRSEVVK